MIFWKRSRSQIDKLKDAVEKMRQRLEGSIKILAEEREELKKLERYRSEFVANVSHELKTPLTAIRSYVETLSDGAIDDKQHNRDFLNKIEKHAINLSSLIDDILELSKLESKNEMGPFVKLEIEPIIRRAIEAVSDKAKSKEVSIKISCSGGPILIRGAEEHIYRAMVNLLNNAVNYTESGGNISVLCLKQDDTVEISVIDTGIGIPEKEIPRIFERFYRIDKARSRELGGTGLGLSIVKHVMSAHNGGIRVESEVGQGSKFTLIFPA